MRKYIPNGILTIPKNAELVFVGKIFNVYQWPQKLYDGTIETFEMLSRKDTVKVIAIKDNKVIITRQKQPRKEWFYDFPGGRNDVPEENELDAAKREMLEETGMTFKTWKLIEVHQPFAKIDWLVYTFIANDFISQETQKLDGGEKIEVKEVSLDELKNLLKTEERLAKCAYIDAATKIEDFLNIPAIYNY